MINAVELEDGDTVNFILGPDGHYYIATAEAAKAYGMQHSRSQADGYYDNGCPILTDDAD